MISFILGMLVGGLLGVGIMVCVQINGKDK